MELVAVADLSIAGKGIDVMVSALELMKDLRCRLTVIGGRPGKSAWGERAARDERIRFLGPLAHQDVLREFEGSDVFLFPTQADPFGLALVEAMASELAVIVSRAAGATADLGVAGRNCLIAEAGSPGSWADCIRLLADDENLRRSIASAARDTIARRWTLGHAVEGMVSGLRLGATAAGRETRTVAATP
jgi:glycosyltransferase involved in cell wall biosynthesis